MVLAGAESVVEPEVGVVAFDSAQTITSWQLLGQASSNELVDILEGLQVGPLLVGGSEVENELRVLHAVAASRVLVDDHLVAHLPLSDHDDDEDDVLALADSGDLLELGVFREGSAEGLAHEAEDLALFG